jgi:F-type H+-transporting ATPase subunit b
MEFFKLFSTNEIIAQVISFLLLLFLLRIFAWGKLLKLLDDRKEKIASEFKSIDDAKLEISKLKTDYEARISNIEEIAKAKIEQALENGRKITEEVREKAHEEAQGIINSAKKDIKYELEKAKEELKDKIIDLTISAAEMVIQEKLTAEGDKKIVKDFLEKVDELK